MKFANVEEDTPSYHRRYDFFVSKFASLCHSNHVEVDVMNSLRVAGLRGIQVCPLISIYAVFMSTLLHFREMYAKRSRMT